MLKLFIKITLVLLGLTTSLLIVETWLTSTKSDVKLVAAEIFEPDSELGHIGKPNGTGEEVFIKNGKVGYQAKIELDSHGFRKIPLQNNSSNQCILFLGDSITFGTGVDGSETTAALIQKNLKESRIVNLGLTAYGPHSSLRLLELQREKDSLTGCKTVKAFYFTQYDHVRRAAGRAPFGLGGPKYRLNNEKLEHAGNFYPKWFVEFHSSPYMRVSLVKLLIDFYTGVNNPNSPYERNLYKAILTEMKRLLINRYNGDLTLVFFNFGNQKNQGILDLETDQIPTVYFEEVPNSKAQILEEYYLPDTYHPNEKGHKLLAEWLIRNSLKNWK